MILSTPNFITTYRAINPRGEREDGTVLHPDTDYAKFLEGEGYKKIEIVETRQK